MATLCGKLRHKEILKNLNVYTHTYIYQRGLVQAPPAAISARTQKDFRSDGSLAKILKAQLYDRVLLSRSKVTISNFYLTHCHMEPAWRKFSKVSSGEVFYGKFSTADF